MTKFESLQIIACKFNVDPVVYTNQNTFIMQLALIQIVSSKSISLVVEDYV